MATGMVVPAWNWFNSSWRDKELKGYPEKAEYLAIEIANHHATMIA